MLNLLGFRVGAEERGTHIQRERERERQTDRHTHTHTHTHTHIIYI